MLLRAVLPRPIMHLAVLALLISELPGLGASPGWQIAIEETRFDSEASSNPSEVPPLGLDLPAQSQAAQAPADEPARTVKTPLRLRDYLVDQGDTLARLAAQFGLNVDTLIWANDLADPDLLIPGTKLVIPPLSGVLHQVRPGDTVGELAGFYGVSSRRIIETNGLEAPFHIVIGQRLMVPEAKMPRRPSLPAPGAPSSTNDVQAPGEPAELAASLGAAPPRPLLQPSGANAEQARFILDAAEAARASQRATGIPASVTIAQAILESFWGSSRLARETNNYFGIKAKERPGTAGVVWFDVWEVVGGANVTQREPFRAYRAIADSFIDHGRFFHQNGRYAAALAARADPKQFAREINRAGYATDPGYASKLIGLMDRFNLYAYDLD